MQIDRRDFLRYVVAYGLASAYVSSDLQGANEMYGLIVKMTIVPGKREEMIRVLKESAADMPGCFSYVVAKDAADENVIWVTEVWDSAASHDASLSLPQVKNAIPQAKPLVANFERFAVTNPVWGHGLPPASR
ncbi:MAG TPA: putative quinol monooxygenase [Candidatus Acidoferrum sp.]